MGCKHMRTNHKTDWIYFCMKTYRFNYILIEQEKCLIRFKSLRAIVATFRQDYEHQNYCHGKKTGENESLRNMSDSFQKQAFALIMPSS